MSYHHSGTAHGFPDEDARLDLTLVYAFPKSGEPGKSILMMNVHPSAGLNPGKVTTDEPFSTEAVCELKIETDGDAVADIAFRVRFSAAEDRRAAALHRVRVEAAAGRGDVGHVVLEGASASTGFEGPATAVDDRHFFARRRSDPLSFGTLRTSNDLQFNGDDFFAETDVCSSVSKLPDSSFGRRAIGSRSRALDRRDGEWVQADRLEHAIEHAGGHSPEEAPQVTRDDVEPHCELLARFPDVAPPHEDRSTNRCRALTLLPPFQVVRSRLCEGREVPRSAGPTEMGVRQGILVSAFLIVATSAKVVLAQPVAHPLEFATTGAILPEEIEWKPFPAFPPSARLAVVVGQPSKRGPYTIRVKVPHGVRLMPHRHPEDRVYTVISGVFYIGLGDRFEVARLQAYPPGAVIVLPGNTSHFHWAMSGEYVTQVSGMGPLGIEYVSPGDDPRLHGD